MLELSLENRLIRACKKRGMLCIKLEGLKGIPDRMVLAPGGKIVFLELKEPKNGVTAPIQKWWQVKVNELGFRVGLFDNWPKIESLLDHLENGPPYA